MDLDHVTPDVLGRGVKGQGHSVTTYQQQKTLQVRNGEADQLETW